MMQFVGDKVSESEGLEVSESDVKVSESGGKGKFPNPSPWKFPNPTLKVSESGGIGKFPNPRAWKFPNPTLKFPNPGGESASFQIRIRGPGSFRIRGGSEFPNPRAWKFPNPTLKFPNPRDGSVSESEGLGVSESAAEVSESDVGPTISLCWGGFITGHIISRLGPVAVDVLIRSAEVLDPSWWCQSSHGIIRSGILSQSWRTLAFGAGKPQRGHASWVWYDQVYKS